MKSSLKKWHRHLLEELSVIAQKQMVSHDPSHDINHAHRTLANAILIAKKEKADLDIVIPAALLHDFVFYPKNDPRAKMASDESADAVAKILKKMEDFPKHKVASVHSAIKNCSFSKGLKHTILEEQIVQDADGLEATGAIAIMRTFASSGAMQRQFYNPVDPFCKKREPDSKNYALDLFFVRLLKVQTRMYTKTARKIAERRTKLLQKFLTEFKLELRGK